MRTYKIALIFGFLATFCAVFMLFRGVFASLIDAFFGEIVLFPLSQCLAAAVLGFGLAWTTVVIRSVTLKLIIAIVALLEIAVLGWLIDWPPFTALTAGVLGLTFGLAYSLSPAGRARRRVADTLEGRVSRDTNSRAVTEGDRFPFQGEECIATVVVCQVLNLQALAENIRPQDLATLSNQFTQTATEALREAGGVVTHCSVEEVCAVFGALPGDIDPAAQACRAALALQQRLATMGADCRTAVETGPLIAGTLGGEFGVTGEALDAARRLCRANLKYGTRLLAGCGAYIAARGAAEARPVDLLRGEWVTEDIYELLANAGGLSPEEVQHRDAFWVGVVLSRAGQRDTAIRAFQALLPGKESDEEEDPLVRWHLEQLGVRS